MPIINKKICEKCMEKHETSQNIKNITEKLWELFEMIFCPGQKKVLSWEKGSSPKVPEKCFYFLEQTLNQKKSK